MGQGLVGNIKLLGPLNVEIGELYDSGEISAVDNFIMPLRYYNLITC